jgi:hypothetical protein
MRILKRGASREPQLDACPRCGALPRGTALVAETFGSACPMCGLTLHHVDHRARGAAGGWALRKRRASSAGWAVRVRVWANASALDALLGQGFPATDSPELTLRADQLASDRTRRALSVALMALVDGAARCDGARVASAPINAAGVLAAAGPLVSLARELRTRNDPAVRGLALASVLVCDGTTSPLYNRRACSSVRDLALQARSALGAP